MKRSGVHQKVMTLFRINLICRFYSFFLTSAVGQGIIRWCSATRNHDNRGKFITVMVLERTTFLFVLCFSVLALQFTLTSPGAGAIAQLIYPSAIMGMLATLIIFTCLFSSRLQGACNHLLARIKATFPFFQRNLFHFRANLLYIYFGHTIVLLKCNPIAIIWCLLYLLRVYWLSLATDAPLDFYQIGWMASLVLFLQMVPITLNGIGLRESVYAMLFSLEALPSEKGVLIGLLFFPRCLSSRLSEVSSVFLKELGTLQLNGSVLLQEGRFYEMHYNDNPSSVLDFIGSRGHHLFQV